MTIGSFRLNTLGAQPISSIPAFSYQYIDTGHSTVSSTVTYPAALQSGDLAVLFDTQTNNTTTIPSAVTPSGFTNISNNVTNSSVYGIRTCISYKRLVGDESETSITGMTAGTLRGEKKLVIYRLGSGITSITWGAVNGQATSSTPSNQTITMDGTGPYIGFAWYFSTGSITSRGSTLTATREIPSSTQKAYVKTFEAPDSFTTFGNTTISMGDYGVNAMSSFRLDLG